MAPWKLLTRTGVGVCKNEVDRHAHQQFCNGFLDVIIVHTNTTKLWTILKILV